jgi:hypothetical protein
LTIFLTICACLDTGGILLMILMVSFFFFYFYLVSEVDELFDPEQERLDFHLKSKFSVSESEKLITAFQILALKKRQKLSQMCITEGSMLRRFVFLCKHNWILEKSLRI